MLSPWGERVLTVRRYLSGQPIDHLTRACLQSPREFRLFCRFSRPAFFLVFLVDCSIFLRNSFFHSFFGLSFGLFFCLKILFVCLFCWVFVVYRFVHVLFCFFSPSLPSYRSHKCSESNKLTPDFV